MTTQDRSTTDQQEPERNLEDAEVSSREAETSMAEADRRNGEGPVDDEPLEQHPVPGQLPSDTDVQAERQEPIG